MKNTLLLLLTAVLGLATARGDDEEHWATGVTRESGWYDFNKTFVDDANMCWAAAACNVLAWWQDRNPAPAGYVNAPVGQEVWSTFKASFNNTDGQPEYAWDWYFTGTTTDALVLSKLTEYGKTQGGYYRELLTTTPQYQYSFIMGLRQDFTDARVYTSALCGLLDDGYGVTLGIQGMVGGVTYGHALTLWGAEVDQETGVLSRIWVTDSDDLGDYHEDKLVVLNCSIKQNTTGKTQYITFQSDPLPNGTYLYPLNEAVLNTFVAVKADASAWMAYVEPVPEPATGTLSVLALAGLCARRRRM